MWACAAGSVDAALLHRAAEEADPAGVVDVVKSDAVDAAHDSPDTRTLRGFARGGGQGAVLAVQRVVW